MTKFTNARGERAADHHGADARETGQQNQDVLDQVAASPIVDGAIVDGAETSFSGTSLADPAGGTTVDGAHPDAAAERRILIDLLIYAWDRARSAGVHERLAAGLAQVGVEVLRPDGAVFDPAAHEVGGVVKTADPLLHNTIAETESAGFRDRERLIREPVVVVYRPQ
jgi:molecular chaperone GrpE